MTNKLKLHIFSLFFFLSIMGVQCTEEPEIIPPPPVTGKEVDVTLFLSTYNGIAKFSRQNVTFTEASENSYPTITINPDDRFQEMDGFGFTLTGGSAMHLSHMSHAGRAKILNELFAHDDENIGVSYLRISIGASDLDVAPFSYNDLPQGETDEEMLQFSLDPDRQYLIPILNDILAINPDIKILGSPWSAPTWMKTNGATIGGELKPEFYEAYARYFVKYIEGMAAEGITIDAITIQNEPLHPGNNPSMYMPAVDQAEFIKTSLGPALEAAGIKTKIIIYDHNADRTDYPIGILNDPDAKKFVDGSAFHLYGGEIGNLSEVHNAHPDKNLYFTEQWIGAPGNFGEDMLWHMQNLIIGAPRNWCKNVLEWNLAANSNLEPHTSGGCTECLGALTIDGDIVTRNPAYYIIAHASKFIRPGAVRINSNMPSGLPNVAYQTTDGDIVIIVLNASDITQSFNIEWNEVLITPTLEAKSVGTFIWKN